MSKKPENPFAFPRPFFMGPTGEWSAGQEGATLRDVFAWQALPIITNQTPSMIAQRAYQIADAMLAERMKEPGA